MSIQKIDSHAHLTRSTQGFDLSRSWPKLRAHGISKIVLGGFDHEDWIRQIQLKDQFPRDVLTSFGIHPWAWDRLEFDGHQALSMLEEFAGEADFVGEVGLDFASAKTNAMKEIQRLGFLKQIQIAARLKKPVVLHVVRADGDVLSGLEKYPCRGGLYHSFRGPERVAKEFLNRGFLLSIGPRSIKRKTPVDYRFLRSDGFLIETDGPKKEWVSLAGELDPSLWLGELDRVAMFLAEVFQVSLATVWQWNRENLERILRR